MTLRTSGLLISIGSLILGAAACESDVDPVNDTGKPGVFESDVLGNGSHNSNGAALDSSASATGGKNEALPTVAEDADDSGSQAARAIEEADIVKIEGTRLYTLSRYGGLSVIDVSTRDQMRLLGRKRVQAEPFEMYVRDQVVFALYNGYGEYVAGSTEGSWNWVTTSYVMAFDTHDPSHPTVVGKFSIPGTIQDSRIVGDALYVVGYEGNGCWQCADGEHTTIVSLNVSIPNAIRKVDERAYADDTTTAWSWKRSITVTDKRMYIAGPEYGDSGPVGSTIQVVDISDPSGKMTDGTKVSAAGKIDSRWQMDESAGVLRVISQPGAWRPSDPPRIQTFTVASAQSIQNLASVDMVVPENESLRSVRFDGARGYAITAIQTDPLFTIDLADPAMPRQVGELAMEGWIYYMEPRGERVVALGYEQGNKAGALAVSLFDVANLAQPKLLSRVNFGGDWAWIGEDQDRVHKAFQVLDSANMVLMPFSGSTYTNDGCYSRYQSGVQLIGWADDALTLQGVAPTVGEARRGFLHDQRLFTVSDERVESFDIGDRTKPVKTDTLRLTEIVTQTLDAGTAVVKIGQNWWTNSVSVDTTTLANVAYPDINGHIDVQIGQDNCDSWTSLGPVLAKNGKVYLLLEQYNYSKENGTSERQTRLVTVDVNQPSSPTILGNATVDSGSGWSYWYYGYDMVNAGASAVFAGNAIVTMSSESVVAETRATGDIYKQKSTLHVIDPTDPSAPLVRTVELPLSLGASGLLASGSTVAVGRYVESPTNPERVRFYVDRIDVSDPAQPRIAESVNVPGSPVAFDAESSNLVTVDYTRLDKEGITYPECYKTYGNSWFEYQNDQYGEDVPGVCHTIQETIYLVKVGASVASVLGMQSLELGQTVSNFAVGDDRVFMSTGASYRYYGGMADVAMCRGCGYAYYAVQSAPLPLLVVGGLGSGQFGLGSVELTGGDAWSYSPMIADGQRVLLSTGWQGKLSVVDASNLSQVSLVREVEVLGSAQSLTAIQGMGVASLGSDGVQTIPIKD